jgi:Fur family ferric uptake transcriptional regulator
MPATESKTLKEDLRKAGLRATGARLAVLRCLIEAGGPLTHGEVCDRLDEAGLDRATVHRNLSDLTQVGLARRRDLGDHLWRFEHVDPADEHHEAEHPHFICTECGGVACLPDGAMTFKAGQNAPKSLKKGNVQIEIRGACNECE